MQTDIINILQDIFAEVLLHPKTELDINRAYVDLGIDSILAIQIAKLIKVKMGIEIRYSDLYNCISISDLATYLTSMLDGQNTKIDHRIEVDDISKKSMHIPNDKIAIIGMAGRFPGANTIQAYWENLLHGKSSIDATNRWEGVGDKAYKAGFLNHIEKFDASFFNISPHEAQLMDPQQRILMEVVWDALADAGVSIDKLQNTKCGVFTTGLPGDYKYYFNNQKELYNQFSFLGNSVSVLSGRISYFFNLKGISINIDTACSSSLVAIDLAKKYLEDKTCDLAIVGASCIFTTPELFELADASKLLSKVGFCRAFDAHADGFVPAETVACLVLSRLSEAENEHQQVYAIIEGSHVNHDGHTNGLMSPNANAQKELIIESYKKYNIDVTKIGYVEAHGTGTMIGDPIEVKALKESFEALDKNYDCFLGSSKTNIGHALVASGLASIIKILLSFQHQIIPPHLHFTQINPQIDLGNFTINTTPEKWLPHKYFSVVSAFGFSGTNAHIILRKPVYQPVGGMGHSNQKYLFIFSAKTDHSLQQLLQSYIVFLQAKNQ